MLIDSLYLLALINPVSKIAVLTAFDGTMDKRRLRRIALRSTLVALFILFISMTAGKFILNNMFKVDIYSLKIAGGIVLFWGGFSALRKGVFFEQSIYNRLSDVSLIPLACPMIAGPATISAVINLSTDTGFYNCAGASLIAVSVNFFAMLFSCVIAKVIRKFNFMGALIRLTGLIVVTMGVQMTLNGVHSWMESVRSIFL